MLEGQILVENFEQQKALNSEINLSLDSLATRITALEDSLRRQYIEVSATYTVLITDKLVNCISGTYTVNLPTAIGNAGLEITVFNSGVGVITLDGFGSETINGSATQNLSTLTACHLVSTGTNWIIG